MKRILQYWGRSPGYALIVLILCLSSLGWAAPVDIGGPSATRAINLNAHGQFLLDPLHQWTTAEDVRNQPWLPLDVSLKRQSFGIDSSILWLRLQLKNGGTELRQIYLVSEDHRAMHLRFFLYAETGLIRTAEFNTFTPAVDKDFPISGFPLLLTLPAGAEREVFISIQSQTPKEVELNAYSGQQLEKKTQDNIQIGYIYVGAVAVIVCYNFFLFLMLREKTYLYYVLFELACGLTLLSEFGLGYRLFWQESPLAEQIIGVSFPTLSSAFVILFTRAYFDFAQNHRTWNAISLVLFVTCLGLTFVSLFWITIPVIFSLYLGVAAVCLAVLLIIIQFAWTRRANALLFAVAWLPFIGIALFNMIMQMAGEDVSSFLLAKLMMASSVWEMICLSLALGERYNRIQRKEVEYLLAIQKKEQQARDAANRAEKERREKGKFADDALKAHMLVRVIAHDLVNPISIISAHCQRMLGALNNPQRVQASIEKIEKAVGNQLSIITHVRDLEAMQSGKHSLAIVPINLQECFASLLEMYQEKLEDKKLTMICDGLGEPVWVFGEETGLVFQVLSNFISNAIKFSQTEGHISCRVRREGEFVSIAISDCGIGMSAELKEALFELHTATTRAGTAGEHGTGFGMPIARSYIQRYGGDIRVSSREISTHPDDHGTEFEILLRPAQGPDDRWTAPLDTE